MSTAAIDLESAAELRAALGRLTRQLRPTQAGAAAGLTPTRASVLLHVVRDGRVRVADVAAEEQINPTMLSRVVADLSAAGLLERECDSGDRRAAWLRATAAGRRLAERVRRERSEALAAALAEIAPEQRAQLLDAVPALEALVEAVRTAQR